MKRVADLADEELEAEVNILNRLLASISEYEAVTTTSVQWIMDRIDHIDYEMQERSRRRQD